MATKTTKNTELDETIVDTEDVVETPKKSAPAKKTPKKYALDERIECRSVTGGELILIGPKTGLQYTWADYGDTAWVEY